MSERYKFINETEYNNIIYRNFPVIIAKSRISYDNKENKIMIQVKLCNVSTEVVDTVYLSLDCYDVSGQLILSANEHVISMLNAEHGQSFGDKIPFFTEDLRISDVKILIKKVVFKSGIVWKNTNNDTGEQVEALKAFDFSGNILTQFKREASPKMKTC